MRSQAAEPGVRPARQRSRAVESKRQARRLRILESAVRGFAKRGFHGTSMEDIASELVMVHGFHGTALALDIDALDRGRRAEVVAFRDRYEDGLRTLIGRAIEAGSFRKVDPKLAAFAIFGAINWISRWYRPSGRASAEEVAAAFADLFLEGLTADRRR